MKSYKKHTLSVLRVLWEVSTWVALVLSSQPAQYIATALSSLMLMWCKLLQMLLPIMSRSECSCMTDLHRSCSWLSSSTCSGLGPGLGSGWTGQG